MTLLVQILGSIAVAAVLVCSLIGAPIHDSLANWRLERCRKRHETANIKLQGLEGTAVSLERRK